MNWLIKTSSIQLFHGSRLWFNNGELLLPQTDGYVHQEFANESILEQYKPPDKSV